MFSRFILGLCSLLVLSFTTMLPAQGLQPYNPSKATNGIMIGLGGSLTIGTMFLDKKVIPMTELEVKNLDVDNIWPIDRFSLRHLSFEADEFTDKLLLTSFASPFFLLLDKTGRDNFDDMAMIVFQGAMLNAALVSLSKSGVKRAHP